MIQNMIYLFFLLSLFLLSCLDVYVKISLLIRYIVLKVQQTGSYKIMTVILQRSVTVYIAFTNL